MALVLYEDNLFKILKGHDYIVVRKDFPYSFHSHFGKYSGAKRLVNLFYRKLQPEDSYFNVAMQRITTEAEFNAFIPQRDKQYYMNINKGVRRKCR